MAGASRFQRICYMISAAILAVTPIIGGWIAASAVVAEPAAQIDPSGRGLTPGQAATPQIDFTRDIQPILAAKCYHCHGSEKQKAELRLDGKAAILAGGESGSLLKGGKAEESLLYQRIAGLGDDERMPPSSKDWLSNEQLALVKAWIEQGARFPDGAGAEGDPRLGHWAYQAPIQPPPPSIAKADWPRNPIDHFILARLERDGMEPTSEADRPTLIRRLSLDLIGLPPTPEEVNAFVADTHADAYERLVDRLLASAQYGEHWARPWLDAARYADSNGYEKDRGRTMWRYRDWVIDALNTDMPYDRFTIEQLAGDMLPNATEAQRIATGFHRNTMINEEGGIDVEEFRYYSVVDRVATTGTVFLGTTLGCAQCHNHKYDPISQREYYQVFALFNNADEPILETPTQTELAQQAQVERKIAELEAGLPDDFPLPHDQLTWMPLDPVAFTSAEGGVLVKQEDGSLLTRWAGPQRDTFTITADTRLTNIVAFRLEALSDSSLPRTGPGLSDGGNFVLSDFAVTAATRKNPQTTRAIKLRNGWADHSQPGFDVALAIDGDPATGWAVAPSAGQPTRSRSAIFETAEPLSIEGETRLVFTLAQNYGGRHVLGRFRLWAATPPAGFTTADLSELRRAHRTAQQAAWEAGMMRSAAKWTTLRPENYASEKGATLTRLDDESILVTGDRPTRDVYTVEYETELSDVTTVRLEVLTDPRLPSRGPGRGGADEGNFMLSELTVTAAPRDGSAPPVPVKLVAASADYAQAGQAAETAIDGDIATGWMIGGGIGRPHQALFGFEKPSGFPGGTRLRLTFIQNYFDQHSIGRFRVSVTDETRRLQATDVPADVQDIFALPVEWRNARQRKRLDAYFLAAAAPELASRQKMLAELRRSISSPTTSLVMQERESRRPTRMHSRGEFLAPGESVEPGVPAALPPLPADQPATRLTFARWLFDERNPLTARVAVNRAWQHLFGRGLVEAAEDFGLRCEPPSHPELLDWLAVEYRRLGWSTKALHRLMVTSAAYRQSSHVAPALLQRDPYNVLLARGPRFRLDAEVVRDCALRASGLLNPEIGGPSVFPVLPEGVASLSYGGFNWPTSTGSDRHRRGLYTYLKRTNPYPSFVTFDQPMRTQCAVRRVRSNTPLQSLTLLNDDVYVEAARALARRIIEQPADDPRERLAYAFRLCLARRPDDFETERLVGLHARLRERFQRQSADAARVALPDPAHPPAGIDLSDLAAWTIVSSTLMNLDEMVTRG